MDRSRGQLLLIVLTGIGHVIVESFAGSSQESTRRRAWTVVLWALRRPGQTRAWGFRPDNVGPALRANLVFVVPACAVLVAYGAMRGRLPLSRWFWVVLPLYPICGIAQQFALQHRVARNLRSLIPRELPRLIFVACVFSLVHWPEAPLMLLTWIAGVAFTWLFERWPNLWVLGLSHGILGVCAYYRC